MCGITGLITGPAGVDSKELREMTKRLQHRGPDNTGFYIQENVGFGHTRLSIIDLAGGDQPIVSFDQQAAMVANGEIYNYIELMEDLIQKGCVFKTRSDSETIMQSYLHYGEAFIHRLHGMFAFALYDKITGNVFLGRDRLGIKPLFYHVSPNKIAFASEIKALLPAMPHAPAINPEALSQFFHNQFNTGDETIINGIRRVLPGEMVTIDKDLRTSHRQYWSPLSTATVSCSLQEAQEEFDSLFEQVMREHIRSDVPYGLFLSGGVDSAVVLSMLHRFQERPIRTFAVGYEDSKMENELEPAQFVSNRFNTKHTPLALSKSRLFGRLPHIIWATDDLMRDYACLPTSFLAEAAAKELKVVFTGEGGDEVFAGYGRYRKSVMQRWIKNLLAPGSDGFRTRSQIKTHWTRALFSSHLKPYHNEFRRPFVQAWQSCPKSWTHVQKSQYVDMVTALADNLLVKVDRILMSFGLEGRVPFLDHRVVKFGLSLPDELKIKSNFGKLFLRNWSERYLPKEHLWRKKTGFHVPAREFFATDMLHKLEKKLVQNQAIKDWFRVEWVRRLFKYQRRGINATRAIWCLMQFAIWHRMFIEDTGLSPSREENPLDWIS